jgi:GT2 family glycosyltransferase
MNNSRVAIIILNWNGWKDTIECLESLYQINYYNFDVIVVDNDSHDESLEKIRNYASGKIDVKSDFFEYNPSIKPIKILEYTKKESEHLKDETKFLNLPSKKLFLIKNYANYGFAEGNNIGIRFVVNTLNTNYILLLNNDTVVDQDFLKEMVNIGESSTDIGIIGPKIYYYDEKNIIWCIGGKIDWKFARGLQIGINEVDNGQYNEIKEFEYVSGSAFLIKREVVDRIGLMDKQFFLYFEESDWALRASQKEYRIVYAPKAEVWHRVSKSGGGITKPLGLYYITRNRWLFMKKWANIKDYSIFVIYQIVGAVIFPLILSIYYRNWKLFMAYYSGLKAGVLSK